MVRFALVLLLGGMAAPLTAQQVPPRVQPGGVATLVVTVDGSAGPVAYTLEPTPGVRLFAPPSGRATAAPGEPIRLPVTFGVPAQAVAGPLAVAELTLERADGTREARELLVEVLARRGARFWVDDPAITATPGSPLELGYRVRNEGNAADTFRIRLTAPSTWPGADAAVAIVLAPGEQRSGAFRSALPARAEPGEEHVLRLTLTAADVRESRSTLLTVVTPDPAVGNLATVPGTAFIGSSTGDEGGVPGMALTAAGEVRPGVRMSLDLRHVNDLAPTPVFRADLSGPRLRLGLDGQGWSARAGDVFSLPDLVSGPVVQGRGIEARFAPRSWHADVLLARPWSFDGEIEGGHVARVSAGHSGRLGTLGLRASSLDRRDDLLGAYRQSGVAVTYSARGAGHAVDAEIGAMRVSADSGAVGGAAAQIRYAFDRGPLSLAARLRRVPGTTARTASHGNEASAFGSYRVTDWVSATGSAYATDAPRVDGGPHGASRGVAAGIRLELPTGLNARVTGALRSTEFPGADLPGAETRLVSAGADVPVGPVVLEAEAELGATRGFTDYGTRAARLGARWSGDGQWGFAGLSHHQVGAGTPRTALNLAGSARFRAAEIQGGLSARLTGADRSRGTSFWSGVTVPVTASTSLSAGAEFRGYDGASPWRFSLGVRRSFGMPLPVARKPVLHGVIFEDLDGDGLRAEGEPALPGIGVRLGAVRTSTDEQGRFRFYDAAADRLRIDASDLPLGVSVGHDAGQLPGRGRAEIPVVHTASIEVRAFLDRNGDGRQDGGEGLAVGAIVTVVPASGPARDGQTDAAGRVRFGGLRPGHYTVVVLRSDGAARAAPVEVPIVLQPGAEERITVAVPLRSRDIRLPGGTPMGAALPPSPVPAPAAAPALARAAPAVAGEDGSAIAMVPPPDTDDARIPDHSAGDAGAPGESPDTASAPVVNGAGGPTAKLAEGGGSRDAGTRRGLLVALILLTPGVAAGIKLARLPSPEEPGEAES